MAVEHRHSAKAGAFAGRDVTSSRECHRPEDGTLPYQWWRSRREAVFLLSGVNHQQYSKVMANAARQCEQMPDRMKIPHLLDGIKEDAERIEDPAG